MAQHKNTIERFWTLVDKTNTCWLWKGTFFAEGYGAFKLDGKTHRAHRLAWFLVNGKIPKGKCLDHLCRVKSCVNPKHLDVVTWAVNQQRGDKARLNAKQISVIRALYARGARQCDITTALGIPCDQVSRIVIYKRWTNIK